MTARGSDRVTSAIPARAWEQRRGERPPGEPRRTLISIYSPDRVGARAVTPGDPNVSRRLLNGVDLRDERRPHRFRQRRVVERGLEALPLRERPAEKVGQLLSLPRVPLLSIRNDPGE